MKPVDLEGVRRYSVTTRPSLVRREDFVGLPEAGCSFGELLDSLPDILAGRELRGLAARIARAVAGGHRVALAMGAHVVKVGLTPLLIDLVDRRIVHGFAMHGAGAIHDLELARTGQTSEDVGAGIGDGSFGMAAETGDAFNRAYLRAAAGGIGLGRALGQEILEGDYPNREVSLLAACAARDVPLAVLVAIGTDIVHMHPGLDPAALGRASHDDFRLLCALVASLEDGVWLNVGSAVLMPEAFLKAINVARNLGSPLARLATADLDMIRHYRPGRNVCERPVSESYRLTGHHEILLPILRLAVLHHLQLDAEGTGA